MKFYESLTRLLEKKPTQVRAIPLNHSSLNGKQNVLHQTVVCCQTNFTSKLNLLTMASWHASAEVEIYYNSIKMSYPN